MNLIRPTDSKSKAKVTTLRIIPYSRPPWPGWRVVLFRTLGLTLIMASGPLAWAAVIANILLGPLWGVGGFALTGLFFAAGFLCFSERFDP